ncbi:MAG: ribosome maturation factor RimM [Candidatus Izemoplasmatales bacterium]|jgi:16S rRNA processing protein RimM
MKLVYIGKIVNTWGLDGYVKVISDTDFKAERYDQKNIIYIKTGSNYDKQQIESYKLSKGYDLLRFKGLADINLVEKYKGKELYVEKKPIKAQIEGEYHIDQIVGLPVFQGEMEVGVVKDVRSYPQSDYLVVLKPDGKTALIPFLDEFVLTLDHDRKMIKIVEMEGLL